MKNQNAIEILKRYREGCCTDAEILILENWYLTYKEDTYDNSHALLSHLYRKKNERFNACNLTTYLYTSTRAKIFERIACQHPKTEHVSALQQFIDRDLKPKETHNNLI